MPAYLELVVLLPLDGATRTLVYRYVVWCYAIKARRPATVCRGGARVERTGGMAVSRTPSRPAAQDVG